jgi:hypothetical protein
VQHESLNKGYGLTPEAQVKVLQLHRLVSFTETFSAYLEGKISPETVRHRAKLMLKAGLPRLK